MPFKVGASIPLITNYLVLRGGKPVCCVNILPGAALTGPREAAPAFTRPCVTGDVLAEADVLFLRRLLV
jgi:hypothetical protein